MNKTTLPQASNWNNYWSLDQTQQFTKISWSKRRIISILNKYVVQNEKALDAGCGSGFFSKYFCDKGIQTTSLDYSDEALAIARKLTEGRTALLKKDLLSDKLANDIEDRFDIIFSDGLLEHFSGSDQDKIITNFSSVLKDGGAIVTFVPNKFSPWELIRPFYMPGIEEAPFTLERLMDVHQRNGLAVIERGGINTLPFAFSPDKTFGKTFGMLLYVVCKKVAGC